MGMFENPFYDSEISSSLAISENKLSETYNCKSRVFPDGSVVSCVHRSDVFGRDEYARSRSGSSLENDRKNFHWSEFHSELERENIVSFSGSEPITLQQEIENNIGLMELGEISASECVIRNQTLYKSAKLINNYNPFSTSRSVSFEPRHDSFKRAKDHIYDYILCNDWDFFFTGTINPKKMDSSKPKDCLNPLKVWLQHMVQRYGISYIAIFEHHKKGRIHMHGLIKQNPAKPLKIVDSGTKIYFGFKKPMKNRTAKRYGLSPENGKTVYNLSTWRFGWSTVIQVYGSPQQLAHYVTKYITKDNKKIFGKYYWHSRDLQKPKVVFSNVDFDSIQSAEYHGYKYTSDITVIIQEKEH